MITPAYCRTMARYNAWQNNGLRRIVETMPDADLRRDHRAFFGSILETLNHLLWGDMLWMARFDGGPAPSVSLGESVEMTPTGAAWAAERFRIDGRITLWAARLRATDLVGDLAWVSTSTGQKMSKPWTTCVTHFFNHQTHHRGQVHAMLTASGIAPDVTDLVFMPD